MRIHPGPTRSMLARSILVLGVTTVLAVPAVDAACTGGGLIEIAIDGSLYLDTPGGNPYPAGYSYYPTLTNGRGEVYWKLGAGDPVSDSGVDSDYVPFVAGGESVLGYPGYFYPATVYGAPWSASAEVDGCPVESADDLDACNCVLITDQFDAIGYSAILSDQTDAGGNFRNYPQGLVALSRIPEPVSTTVNNSPMGVDIDLTVPLPSGGIFEDPACACGPVGFGVYAVVVPSGSQPPTDRDRGQWLELTGDPVTFGETTTVSVSCAAGDDVYLAASLRFPDGYESFHVSSNAGPIGCACTDDDLDGFCAEFLDCDDSSGAVYPGAPEICDGVNNDCNSPEWPGPAVEDTDDDGDSFTECDGDCDDTLNSVFPGAEQLCDGLNNDCNSPSWPDLAGTNEADSDADGFRGCDGDCDDTNANINPAAVEIAFNFIDENCDGNRGECDPCADWTNHGQYVRCVANAVNDCSLSNFTPEEADQFVNSAVQSDIGKPGFVPPECR